MRRVGFGIVSLFMVASGGVAAARSAGPVEEVQAAAGRDTAKPMKPDWCQGQQGGGDLDDAVRTIDGKGPLAALYALLGDVAKASCSSPNEPEVQKAAARYRQRLINATGLSDGEIREALRLFAGDGGRKELDAWCAADRAAGNGTSYGVRAEAIAVRNLFCGNNAFPNPPELTWRLAQWLDNPAYPQSELALIAHVNSCISEMRDDDEFERNKTMQGYLLCGGDAKRLDRAKLDAEIKARKLPPAVALIAKLVAGQARAKGEAAEKVAKRLGDENRAWAKALQAHAEATAKWEALYKKAGPALEKAYAFEAQTAAGTKVTADQCDALRKSYRDYVQAGPVKTPEDVLNGSTDAVGYVLLSRLAGCDGQTGRPVDAAFELALAQESPLVWAGPRMFVAHKVFPVFAKAWPGASDGPIDEYKAMLGPDEPSYAASFGAAVADAFGKLGSVKFEEIHRAYETNGGSGSWKWGKIATMKPNAEATAATHGPAFDVTFSADTWDEATGGCAKKSFKGYSGQGNAQFDYSGCKVTGANKRSFQQEPITLVGWTATTLPKVKQKVRYMVFQFKGKQYGIPLAVTVPVKGETLDKPLNYFGFDLK